MDSIETPGRTAAEVIANNLERFGLPNLSVTVTAAVERWQRSTAADEFQVSYELTGEVITVATEMPLAEVCAYVVSLHEAASQGAGLERDYAAGNGMNLRCMLEVTADGKTIGGLNCDGVFHACDMSTRDTLGYLVATDGGRERLLEGIDLDAAAKALRQAAERTDEQTFFGWFAGTVRWFVNRDRGTARFCDSDYGARTPLWQAATRENGTPHEGYPFFS